MDEKRPPRLAPPLIAAAVLLPTILLVVYVAGYFWLGTMEQVWIDQKPGISISHDGPVPGAVPCR